MHRDDIGNIFAHRTKNNANEVSSIHALIKIGRRTIQRIVHENFAGVSLSNFRPISNGYVVRLRITSHFQLEFSDVWLFVAVINRKAGRSRPLQRPAGINARLSGSTNPFPDADRTEQQIE